MLKTWKSGALAVGLWKFPSTKGRPCPKEAGTYELYVLYSTQVPVGGGCHNLVSIPAVVKRNAVQELN